MAGARYDVKFALAGERIVDFAVQLEDGLVVAADDQQRGRGHVVDDLGCYVDAAAAGDDRVGRRVGMGRAAEGGRRAGARAEVADRVDGHVRPVVDPRARCDEPIGQ